MPPVEAPPPSLHACHPPPWLAPRQAAFQEQLACELWPRARPLHRIVCNMRTQFPDLRLIQYDCGEFLSISRPSVFVLFWDKVLCFPRSFVSPDLLPALRMTLNTSTPNYSWILCQNYYIKETMIRGNFCGNDVYMLLIDLSSGCHEGLLFHLSFGISETA